MGGRAPRLINIVGVELGLLKTRAMQWVLFGFSLRA
jgi:hypothetical protein